MINYQYTETPYVDPVNLEILGKTYDTLEEGHHKAVESESALKAQIANLPLNEAEDGFKQALLNDLNATIEENTRFGNKYSALDDIVRVNGDISSNPGLIGRLKAQEDYMAFQDALDKAEIPDAYKEMYRELNPYSYQDKYDKDGNVIGGTKWTPTSRPVKTIDLSDIITKGISWASAEAGGSTVTRWLDENGQLTTDPTKAFDGEYYDATKNSWQRLGRDKILAGIQAAIESTPGAKESLEQDYKFAEWKHNKLVKESNGQLVISDITDERGMKLTPQEYLMKRIEPAVYAKEYYNSVTKTTYGGGLASYRKAQAAAALAEKNYTDFLESTTNGVPITFTIDPGVDAMSNKNNSIARINELVEKATGKNPLLKLGAIEKIGNKFDDILNNPNIDAETKLELRNYILLHDEAATNLESFMKDMGEDKELFEFATRMESGGQLIAGATKFDDEMLGQLSRLTNENGDIEINFEEGDEIRDKIINIINGGDYDGYKNLGIEFTDKGIKISKNNINNAPMIMSIINKAQTQRNKGFWETVEEQFVPFNFALNEEYSNDKNAAEFIPNLPWPFNIDFIDDKGDEMGVIRVGHMYDEAIKNKNKLYEKYMPSAFTITTSTLLYSGGTWNQKELDRQYEQGLITEQQYNIKSKRFKEAKEDFINHHQYAQGKIYALNKESNTLMEVVDSGDRIEIGKNIKVANQNSKIKLDFTPGIAKGLTDVNGNPVTGYYVSYVDVDKDGEPVDGWFDSDDGEHTYFIPTLINEDIQREISSQPSVRANTDLVRIGNAKEYKNLSRTSDLRGTSIQGVQSGVYEIKFLNHSITVDETTASTFLTSVYTYQGIKNMVASGIPLDQKHQPILDNCAYTIAQCTGLSPEAVAQEISRSISQYYK